MEGHTAMLTKAKWHPVHGLHRGLPKHSGCSLPFSSEADQTMASWELCPLKTLPSFSVPPSSSSHWTPVVLAPQDFLYGSVLFCLPTGTPYLMASKSFYDLIWGMTERVSSSNHIMANQIWDSFGRPWMLGMRPAGPLWALSIPLMSCRGWW